MTVARNNRLSTGGFFVGVALRRSVISSFQGVLDGVAMLANNNGNPFTEDITYNVQVQEAK
jgi:hypothetical protein